MKMIPIIRLPSYVFFNRLLTLSVLTRLQMHQNCNMRFIGEHELVEQEVF